MNVVPTKSVIALIAAGIISATGVYSSIAAAADFYSGKRIRLIVGTSAGGGYDGYARLLARHIESKIPGQPNFVVQNMPGASGVKAVNYFYHRAPKDGTVLATFNNAMPVYQVLGRKGIRFNVNDLNFIGAMSQVNNVLAVWHTTGVRTIDDAKRKSVIMGATGSTGTMAMFPTVLNNLAGTKFKVVTGYRGGSAVNLALERGEIQGRGSNPWTSWKAFRPEWIRDGKLKFLVQMGIRRHPELPNVPTLIELAKNDEQRDIFKLLSSMIVMERPFAAPPGVSAARIALLRRAFDAAVRDPALLAEAKKRRMDISPSSGAEVQKVVAGIIGAPPAIIDKAKILVRAKKSIQCKAFTEAKYCRSKKKKKKKSK